MKQKSPHGALKEWQMLALPKVIQFQHSADVLCFSRSHDGLATFVQRTSLSGASVMFA